MPRRPLNCSKAEQAVTAPEPVPKRLPSQPRSKPKPVTDESSATGIATPLVERFVQEYLLDCDYRLHSAHTIATRRVFTHNLMWFLKHRGFERCGARELKQFFFYLARGHEEPGGRWGQARFTKPMRPVSIKDYHTCLRLLFAWTVDEEILASSPMVRVERPRVCEEVKQPLSPQQVEMLLRAARLSENPKRDEAIGFGSARFRAGSTESQRYRS